jgi:hypothetical protein
MLVIRPLLKTVVHIMANVDQSSSILLNLNENVVNFAVDHNIPPLVQFSLESVQFFDHFGTNIIALALWLASFLKDM